MDELVVELPEDPEARAELLRELRRTMTDTVFVDLRGGVDPADLSPEEAAARCAEIDRQLRRVGLVLALTEAERIGLGRTRSVEDPAPPAQGPVEGPVPEDSGSG